MLLDAGVIRHHQSDGVQSFTQPAVKDGANGIFFGEEFFAIDPKLWEARIDNGYPTIIYDPEIKKYRLYYTLFIIDPSATSTPLKDRPSSIYRPSHQRVTAFAVAESDDGISWVKPSLGLVECAGSKDNNLIAQYFHGTGLLLDAQEKDRRKRYKLITRIDDGEESYMAIAYSEDGIHFSAPRKWQGENPRADSHNAPFQDEVTGRFYITTREWRDGARVSVSFSSDDFETWVKDGDILKGNPPFDQIYSMPIFRHRNHYVGLASIYHEGNRSAANFDRVDCELATAFDLDSWSWINQGQPLIERGRGNYPTGDFDAGCIYAAAPIEIDGQTWIYYCGGNGRHTGFRETSFARASVDLDRLAGYRKLASASHGRLLLGPFEFHTMDFEILADLSTSGDISWRLVVSEIEQDSTHSFTSLSPTGQWQRLISSDYGVDISAGQSVYVELRIKDGAVFGISTQNIHKRFR